jgi:alcohol dehydrogenase class IV
MSTPATRIGEQTLHFEFATAGRIAFGCGALNEVGALASGLGHRALLITGKAVERSVRLKERLATAGVSIAPFSIPGEPTVPEVLQARELARAERCDMVIGFGGGSAIDAAKAVSALLTNPGDPFDYLEVVGRGQPLTHPAAPCVAIPTTAGTGAEVTRNAVLASPQHAVKVSLRSPLMLPRVAIIDPELTYDLPKSLTAATGLDALTQLIEPYVSLRANPITDGFCLDGIRRVARSLERACTRPHDTAAREDMALASLLGGLSLANAGLGAVHGFAGPVGGSLNAPHGAVCAALLAPVVEANIQALRLRSPSSPVLARFRYIARLLTGKEDSLPDASASWVREITGRLELPRLRDLGVRHEHFPSLIDKAIVSSSMKANPIRLTPAELKSILDRAW